jgi:glycosidase
MKYIALVCVMVAVSFAVKPQDLMHRQNEIFYVNPAAGEIRLRALKGSVNEAYVVIDGRYTKMSLNYQDASYDYFAADFGKFDSLPSYKFIVRDATDSLVFPAAGDLKAAVDFFQVPSWAAGKVYYSVFVDGFYNGNAGNDPSGAVGWGVKPDKQAGYGGDLMGVMNKLTYLDSIGYEVLWLQPVFAAQSNHKFNVRDYSMVDPAFGDTADIRNLVSEVHRRKKRIVLSVVVTHTGSDFPAFEDLVKNGTASGYYKWYQILQTPVRLSASNYECWRGDPHFPKLNLKEPAVRSYLLGYLDYWLHFGFDGIFLGEDDKIDADFVAAVRDYLKAKYPGVLLLGSDSRRQPVSGFDGIGNSVLNQLMIDYFVTGRITTSEFDQRVSQLFFFSPSQCNSINLLSPTGVNARISGIASPEIVRNIYAFIFTFCGSPVITYGDEVGAADYAQLNLGSFPWEAGKQNRRLLDDIKKLLEIRRTIPAITGKYFYTLYANDITRVYAYDRGGLIAILNSGEAPCYMALPAWNGSYIDLVSGEKYIVAVQQLRLSINAKSYRILKREL